jgi:hypothetical protein
MNTIMKKILWDCRLGTNPNQAENDSHYDPNVEDETSISSW